MPSAPRAASAAGGDRTLWGSSSTRLLLRGCALAERRGHRGRIASRRNRAAASASARGATATRRAPAAELDDALAHVGRELEDRGGARPRAAVSVSAAVADADAGAGARERRLAELALVGIARLAKSADVA